MKKIKVRYECDKSLDRIDIVIRARDRDEQVDKLIESLTAGEGRTLTVLDGENRPSVIEEDDIIIVSSDGKTVRVTALDGIYRAKQSLQNIENLLSHKFLRVSRFELINLSRVSKYDFTIVGTLRIEFENGMETWASRRYIPLIKERLSEEEGYLC